MAAEQGAASAIGDSADSTTIPNLYSPFYHLQQPSVAPSLSLSLSLSRSLSSVLNQTLFNTASSVSFYTPPPLSPPPNNTSPLLTKLLSSHHQILSTPRPPSPNTITSPSRHIKPHSQFDNPHSISLSLSLFLPHLSIQLLPSKNLLQH